MSNVLAVRGLIAIATITTVAALIAWQVTLLSVGGLTLLEWALLAVQTVLLVPIALSFWLATLGAASLLRSRRSKATETPVSTVPPADLRTAILVPVYNESAPDVFARVAAMRQSIAEVGWAEHFDFYVLSDSNQPDAWVAEEIEWAEARGNADVPSIFYRRRSKNVGRKAGNLKDFCQRWGAAYKYLVTLDADSLMTGETLAEMVVRMEANDNLGLLQTVPQPVLQRTLWARCQQFAAALYGPVYAEGYRLFSEPAGNYWGHNAIVRREAFVSCCGLSSLPGKVPLGGEVLSHDFVEAALMRRAGYEVRLATDLQGSYEECPPSLPAFAVRDRRWCQGNLQHAQLVLRGNIPPMNRVHMLLGVMAYCAAPLWLLTIMLGIVALPATQVGEGDTLSAGMLFSTVMALLLAPRVWALGVELASTAGRRFGGALRMFGSMLLETLVSVVVAPIMMLYHSRFVVTTIAGRVVQWTAQARTAERLSLTEAIAAHASHTVLGVVATAAVMWLDLTLTVWLSPVLTGLVFSVPLSMLISNARIGDRVAETGWLRIPTETDPPDVLRTFAATAPGPGFQRSTIERILSEPLLAKLHESVLAASGGRVQSMNEADRKRLVRLASESPEGLSPEERRRLLTDRDTFREVVATRVANVVTAEQLSP